MLPNSYPKSVINHNWNFQGADSIFSSAFKSAMKWFWLLWRNMKTQNAGVQWKESLFFFPFSLSLLLEELVAE